MIKEREVGELERWIEAAMAGKLKEVKGLAEGLSKDEEGVEAALEYKWTGTEMTALAKAYKERTGKNDSEVVAAFGGLPGKEKVWISESIVRSKQVLVIDYVVLVLGIAGAIFALTEGIIRKTAQRRTYTDLHTEVRLSFWRSA